MAAIVTAVAVVLIRVLGDYPWSRLGAELSRMGMAPVALAGLLTAASYIAMTGYDALALRYVGQPLPYRHYGAASFVATAFGNSLGASAVVGAAIRARVYSAWGLPGAAITRVIGFNLVTLSLGCLVLAGAGAVSVSEQVAAALGTSRAGVIVLGLAMLLAVAGYLAWCGSGKPPAAVRAWRVDRPSRGLALSQIVLSTAEWLSMAAVLYALLPAGVDLGFVTFAVMFVIATAAGLISNLPGGLGVFESVLLIALGADVPSASLVTALIAYRFIYYVAPLVVAAVLLVLLESQRERAVLSGLAQRAGVLTPSVMGLGVGAIGLFLVLSGDLPGDSALPDTTSFTASVAGLVLLLLARGLHRRLRGAWMLALAVLAATLPNAALHGSPGLAAAAGILIVLLVLARTAFYRTTAVLSGPRGWGWAAAIGGGFSLLIWWHDLWVGYDIAAGRTLIATSLHGATPPVIRAALIVALLAIVVAGTRLQRPSAHAPETASPHELQLAEPILATASHGNASLVWTGDKRLIFSSNGNALLMYQIEGRSWVVMSDPIGAEDEFEDLIVRFVALCDRNCGRPAFYSVREDLATLYCRNGFELVKLGEEATVPLPGFSLEGKARAKLRSECRASVRAGCEISVLHGAEVAAVLPQLRAVSDVWLAERNAKEKTFSLGAFDEKYVVRFPVAVARLDGAIVAFASLWASGARHEVKVDLMRRLPCAPRTVMSHLFVESMIWARDHGYASFSLGMAPLSGLPSGRAASLWHRAGAVVWTHGERFYNFQGIRQFKQRFNPEWETRYVASRGGPALPVTMLNVACLVGGGLRGLVSR
jgi:lysylphosphatidylglycerol synthetase-like protein (DUF2156 family)